MRYCIIKNCNGSTANHEITLHRFPTDPTDRRLWINFVNKFNVNKINKNIQTKIKTTSYICSRHFHKNCFIENGRFKTIRKSQVPSIPVENLVMEQENVLQQVQEVDINTAEAELLSGPDSDNSEQQIASLRVEVQLLKNQLEKSELQNSTYQTRLAHKSGRISQYLTIIKKSKQKLARVRKKSDLVKKSTTNSIGTFVRESDFEQTPKPDSNFRNTFNSILERETKPRNCKYSPALREFAMQIHFYSPKAYHFIRELSSRILPNPTSFQVWTSNIDTRPGFFPDSFRFLQKQNESATTEIFYAISLDEMSIRKQLIFDGKRMQGFTDYGGISHNEIEEAATNALFIMATQINRKLKIPLGYILTNGSDADLISKIIKTTLQMMYGVKGRVLSITFDGLPANFAAAESLGANLDVSSPNFKTYIICPFSNHKVYIFPDPCHMLKLVRNMLEAYECLYDVDGNDIKWDYFNQLAKLQSSEGLKLANKLTVRHVNFSRQIMKVKLAVQLLSSSCATSLNVCEQIGLNNFIGSSSTANFARICDRVFDMLNSRPTGSYHKAPLAKWNADAWRKLIHESTKYFLGLKKLTFNKKTGRGFLQPLVKSKRSTCAVGLITAMKSLETIMDEIVLPGTSSLKYLPTYKMSQDMLELFFSTVRQRLGNNNNPNVVQLKSTLKRILTVKILPNMNANCTEQEEVLTCRVSPFRNLNAELDLVDPEPEDEFLLELQSCDLSDFTCNVVRFCWPSCCEEIGLYGMLPRLDSKRI